MIENQINAIISIVSIFGFFMFFYGPWQQHCTDVARQRLFKIRDDIFDLGIDGQLDFSSTDYKIIRSDIEALIRYAHHISVPRFIFYKLFMPPVITTNDRSLHSAIEQINNPELHNTLLKHEKEVHKTIVRLMGQRSLPIVLLTLAGLLVRIVSRSGIGQKIARNVMRQAQAEDNTESLLKHHRCLG